MRIRPRAHHFGRVFDARVVMIKKRIFALLLVGLIANGMTAQGLAVRKGQIIDSIPVNDSIPESFALYLPRQFDASIAWPVLFVFDMKGRARQAIGMFQRACEERGYILAASNNTNDSLSIEDNILVTSRMFKSIYSYFPVQKQRIYTGGFAGSAQMAALVPAFVNSISGVISIGSDIPNTEILNNKKPLYFLGIVGKGDFNYPDLLRSREILNRKDIPNNLLLFDGIQEWPDESFLTMALDILTLQAMAKGQASKDEDFVTESYQQMMGRVQELINGGQMLMAYSMLEEMDTIFENLMDVGPLDDSLRTLKRSTVFRSQRRNENHAFLKESLVREDYLYYLEQDIITYNFNNLGWWNFQMEELGGFEKSSKAAERFMGQRLRGYLNALIEDTIDLLKEEKETDEEALLFLWMLKTITAPKEFSYYLRIISLSSKYEDYGTALFYLEELLKNGYDNSAELYALENTALLRITPEYNAIIDKYLKEARYDIIEE